MLKQRVITAAWLIPVVLSGVFFLPASYFAWALVGVFCIAAKEWGRIIDSQCHVTQWSFSCTLGVLLVVLNLVVPVEVIWINTQLHPVYFTIMMLGALWWTVSFLLVISYPRTAKYWQTNAMLKSMFGQLTLLPCFAALMTLKTINSTLSPYLGPLLVLFVMLVVWAADSGAYFVGKSFGKTKLLPSVSPAKTLEGLLGGVMTTMLIVAAVMYIAPDQEFMLMLSVTVCVALVSALGDLSESMFKRAACIKDSGTILPGHGGVLDRIDSLTAALPIFTLIYLVIWV